MIWCLNIDSHFSISRCIRIKLHLICCTFLKWKIWLYKLHTIIHSSLFCSLNGYSVIVDISSCLSLESCHEFPICIIGKILFYRKISIVNVIAVCIRVAKCNIFYRTLNIFIIAILLVNTDIINLERIVFKACVLIWISYPASTYCEV